MKLENQTILITSNEPWGDVWYSKQHYAYELSKKNTVYFINAPTQWKFSFGLKTDLSIEKISDSFFLVNYSNPFPLRLFPKFFAKLNDRIIGKQLIKKINPSTNVIWWQFDPFRFVNLPKEKFQKRIYHVVDPYEHIWSDAEIAKRADAVIIVSEFYRDRYKDLNKNVFYIPHGILSEDLRLNAEVYQNHKAQLGSDYILFVGTINPDVDIALLEKIADHFPKHKLVIIGPTKIPKEQLNSLFSKENVSYLGTQKATILKEYVALAKVGIVPYKQNKTENVHRTPLKILTYISQACPIVTTLNYELNDLNDKIIFTTQKDNFIQTLDQILHDQKTIDKTSVQQYQQEVLYTNLIEKISTHV